MSTSPLGTVLDDIRAALILRENLSGVNVYSGPVTREEGGEECVWFGDAHLMEAELAMGGKRSETWDVEGEAWTFAKPWQGSTEETIKAARDRAFAIYAEIETHLNDTYTSQLPDVTLTSGDMRQGIETDGRGCAINFTMTVKTSINP